MDWYKILFWFIYIYLIILDIDIHVIIKQYNKVYGFRKSCGKNLEPWATLKKLKTLKEGS